MRLGETDLMLSPPCRDTGTARQGSHPVLGVLSMAGDPFSWIRHHPAARVGQVALLELRRWQGTEEGSPQRVTMMRGDSGLRTLPTACSHPSHMHRFSERRSEIFPASSAAMTC